jgi:hypothetical protein
VRDRALQIGEADGVAELPAVVGTLLRNREPGRSAIEGTDETGANNLDGAHQHAAGQRVDVDAVDAGNLRFEFGLCPPERGVELDGISNSAGPTAALNRLDAPQYQLGPRLAHA